MEQSSYKYYIIFFISILAICVGLITFLIFRDKDNIKRSSSNVNNFKLSDTQINETLKYNSSFLRIFNEIIGGIISNSTEESLRLSNLSFKDIFSNEESFAQNMARNSRNPKVWNILTHSYYTKLIFYVYCYSKYVGDLISNNISIKEYLIDEESRFNNSNENYWVEEGEKYKNVKIIQPSINNHIPRNENDEDFLEYFYKTLLITLFEKMSDYLGYNMFDKFNLKNVDGIKLGELMVTFNRYPNLNKPNLWETAISYKLPTVIAFWVTFQLFKRLRLDENTFLLVEKFKVNYFEHYDYYKKESEKIFNDVETWNFLVMNRDIFFNLD